MVHKIKSNNIMGHNIDFIKIHKAHNHFLIKIRIVHNLINNHNHSLMHKIKINNLIVQNQFKISHKVIHNLISKLNKMLMYYKNSYLNYIKIFINFKFKHHIVHINPLIKLIKVHKNLFNNPKHPLIKVSNPIFNLKSTQINLGFNKIFLLIILKLIILKGKWISWVT